LANASLAFGSGRGSCRQKLRRRRGRLGRPGASISPVARRSGGLLLLDGAAVLDGDPPLHALGCGAALFVGRDGPLGLGPLAGRDLVPWVPGLLFVFP